jgi:opacity protein-like surface antigen
MIKTFGLGIVFAAALWAQPFGAGIKAGVPATDFFSTQSGRFPYIADTRRWTLGPMFELRLPFGLGVELDVLYKKFDYRASFANPGASIEVSGRGSAWEFPLVGKYRFPGRVARPYVEAGLASRRVTGLKEITLRATPPTSPPVSTSTETPAILANKATAGIALGGGIEVKALLLRVSPGIRYTRWGSRNFQDINGAIVSNENQLEFLVGISF